MTDLGLSGSDPAELGSSEVQAVWRKDAPLIVAGRIGVVATQPSQCHLLRTADGDPFALVGRLPGLAEGEAVQVAGTLAAWSTCETYRTLRIERIERIPAG